MSEISSIASANTRLQKRLIGRTPKVGIRESLEGQTMRTGRRAVALITENLRHPHGAKVECVIADTCIGGTAEAAQCAEKFEREGLGLSLTVTPCWCYGAETVDMHAGRPKAIWGFNGSERVGTVYLFSSDQGGARSKGTPTSNDDFALPSSFIIPGSLFCCSPFIPLP